LKKLLPEFIMWWSWPWFFVKWLAICSWLSGFFFLVCMCLGRCYKCFRTVSSGDDRTSVAFFHPYAGGCGGGERVLWQMVNGLLKVKNKNFKIQILIYSGDSEPMSTTLEKVHKRFGLRIPETAVRKVNLRSRTLLEAKWYPVATMIGQAVGSLLVGMEALLRFPPDVFVDTTGCPFTYPTAALFGSDVVCYTHYPTISTDMLSRVRHRRAMYNNSRLIARSKTLTDAKIFYYGVFADLYKMCGSCVNLAFVNSSWTEAHIRKLWKQNPIILYPPVDCEAISEYPFEGREPHFLSVGQFRPEKDHALQIEAFAQFVKDTGNDTSKLILVGGVRDEGDEARVERLRATVENLGLPAHRVEFRVNLPFNELQTLWRTCLAGVHSMRDEHFGICVVEYQAAGLVTIAHNSGGPKEDIVVEGTGLLCENVKQYAEAMTTVIRDQGQPSQLEMLKKAREHTMATFGEAGQFELGFIGPLLELTAMSTLAMAASGSGDDDELVPLLAPEKQKDT